MEIATTGPRHQRTGLPLKGCPASNAIKGNHERDASGRCALCGDGPAGVEGTFNTGEKNHG